MLKSTKLKSAAITMVTAIVAAVPRLANACATCGLADGDQAFHAYKTSVLFMLASPYASFAAIGGITYFVYRRSTRQDRKSNTK
jgi:H+/gluconate symporter-like permease